eukprot:scaffold437945_cov10-Prasinocladus_malaysianus.AAC.1
MSSLLKNHVQSRQTHGCGVQCSLRSDKAATRHESAWLISIVAYLSTRPQGQSPLRPWRPG